VRIVFERGSRHIGEIEKVKGKCGRGEKVKKE